MKRVAIAIIVLILMFSMVGCTPTPSESTSPMVVETSPSSDQQILQDHSDHLDEALQELDLINQ